MSAFDSAVLHMHVLYSLAAILLGSHLLMAPKGIRSHQITGMLYVVFIALSTFLVLLMPANVGTVYIIAAATYHLTGSSVYLIKKGTKKNLPFTLFSLSYGILILSVLYWKKCYDPISLFLISNAILQCLRDAFFLESFSAPMLHFEKGISLYGMNMLTFHQQLIPHTLHIHTQEMGYAIAAILMYYFLFSRFQKERNKNLYSKAYYFLLGGIVSIFTVFAVLFSFLGESTNLPRLSRAYGRGGMVIYLVVMSLIFLDFLWIQFSKKRNLAFQK